MISDEKIIENLLWHDVCANKCCDSCKLTQDEDACYSYLLSETAKHLVSNNVIIQKFGQWKQSANGYVCSVCNNWSRYDTYYCPECGARNQNKGESYNE